MNTYTDSAGKRHSHIHIEWRGDIELAEVTDTSPAAYARQLDIPVESFLDAQRHLAANRIETTESSARGVRAVSEATGVSLGRLMRAMEDADLGVNAETLEYTRIEMGVSRLTTLKHQDGLKEVLPPYACVVGERFTGEWGRVRRPFVLLDEATTLYDVEYPDLDDFLASVVALKDIYHGAAGSPVRIYCSGQRQDLAAGAVTGPQDYFFASLQRAHGLTWYQREQEDTEVGRSTDEQTHRGTFPFFLTMDHTGAILEPPFVDDADLAAHKLNALFAHDQLEIRPHCHVYDRLADVDGMPGPKLAVAYAALAMEYVPWAEQWRRSWQAPTGYDLPDPAVLEEADRKSSRSRRKQRAITAGMGGPLTNDRQRRRMAQHLRRQREAGVLHPSLHLPSRKQRLVNQAPSLADMLSAVARPGVEEGVPRV